MAKALLPIKTVHVMCFYSKSLVIGNTTQMILTHHVKAQTLKSDLCCILA